MNADGTFDVQDNGTSILTGTWEAQSATAGTAKTSDGQEVRLEIAGGSKLIFDGSQSGVKKIICVASPRRSTSIPSPGRGFVPFLCGHSHCVGTKTAGEGPEVTSWDSS